MSFFEDTIRNVVLNASGIDEHERLPGPASHFADDRTEAWEFPSQVSGVYLKLEPTASESVTTWSKAGHLVVIWGLFLHYGQCSGWRTGL